MTICLQEKKPGHKRIITALKRAFAKSRFQCNRIFHLFYNKRYKHGVIYLHEIRLRKRRHYYGNKPSQEDTKLMRRTRGIPRIGYLMAVDWVEFNDLINNVLDSLRVKAFVTSFTATLRLGFRRRVKYQMKEIVVDRRWVMRWEKCPAAKDTDSWQDHTNPYTGIFPVSKFPSESLGQYGSIHCQLTP